MASGLRAEPRQAFQARERRFRGPGGAISANGDLEIGDIIAHAVKVVGKDGVITIEESKTMHTGLETVDGMQFDRGYLSLTSSPMQNGLKWFSKTLHPDL